MGAVGIWDTALIGCVGSCLLLHVLHASPAAVSHLRDDWCQWLMEEASAPTKPLFGSLFWSSGALRPQFPYLFWTLSSVPESVWWITFWPSRVSVYIVLFNRLWGEKIHFNEHNWVTCFYCLASFWRVERWPLDGSIGLSWSCRSRHPIF